MMNAQPSSPGLRLTEAELRELTAYRQPAAQLAELHRLGFARARRDRFGRVVLERAHYDAVCAGATQPARPKVRLMQPPPTRKAVAA